MYVQTASLHIHIAFPHSLSFWLSTQAYHQACYIQGATIVRSGGETHYAKTTTW